MRSRPRKKQAGFSLIETMVSGLIMGVGVMGAMSLYTTTADARQESRSMTMAKGIIEQRMEWLAATGYLDYEGCTGTVGCKANAYDMHPDLAPNGGLLCTQYTADDTLVTPDTNTPGAYFRVDTVIQMPTDTSRFPGVRDAIVSVCWTDENNIVHQMQLRRMITE